MNKQAFPARDSKLGAAKGPPSAVIAGAGLMGYWHAQAIARAGGRVLAVVDRDAQAAQRLADRLPQARPYPSLKDAAAEQALDALHVCTPTPSHVALAEAGLERGLHVLVEKPLAPDAAQTGRLLELAASRGLMLCPVHQFIFQEGVQEAKRRLRGMGRLLRLHVEIRSAGGAGMDEDAQEQVVADILPHCLALAEFMLPNGAQQVAWRSIRPAAGELCVFGTAGAAVVVFDLSLHGRPPINRCTLVGEAGSLLINLFHGYAVFEAGAVSKLHKVVQPFVAGGGEVVAAAANLGRRGVRRQTAYPGLWELIGRFYHALAVDAQAPIAPGSVMAVACARDAILAQVKEAGL